jgi:hypothetical protein
VALTCRLPLPDPLQAGFTFVIPLIDNAVGVVITMPGVVAVQPFASLAVIVYVPGPNDVNVELS